MTVAGTLASNQDVCARSTQMTPVPGGRGVYLDAYYFFTRETRGAFACYQRARANGEIKSCVRAELLALPAERERLGAAPITFELSLSALRRAVAVARGERAHASVTIPRPGHLVKTFELHHNPDGTWVIQLTEGARSLKGLFESEGAFQLQAISLALFRTLYASAPHLVPSYWDAFLAVPVDAAV